MTVIIVGETLTKDEQIIRLKAENAELKSMVEMFRFELMDLKRRIYGSKSERFTSPDQISLDLDVEPIADQEVATQEVQAHTREKTTLKIRNHKGRLAFPSHLRREITVLEPEGNTEGLKTIGVDATETLEYNPGSFYVNRIERIKYAERGNQGVLMAALPERILGKSMIGNSFAAHAMVSKFVDHCPEYRLIQILRREDIHLPSSTLNDTTASVAHALELLYSLHTERVLKSSYLEADETPNRVMTKEKKGKTHQGYYWAYRSPVNKLVLFDYRPSRTGHGPRDMLKNFKGDLQTDGYSVYDEFGKHKDITLFHCWAHARRYFDKALKNDKVRASFMMQQIQLLYDIERRAREETYSIQERFELRQKESLSILSLIKAWLDAARDKVRPKSPIGKAITYSLKRWKGLCHYTSDGMLEIDNNLVENCIRPLTLGRKNYMFAGSHDGAKWAAIFYSFFGTCKLKGINPYTWLKNTLDKLPVTPVSELYTLLP